MRIRGRAPDGLVFELGLRAGGPPLARYGSGDLALAQPPARPSSSAAVAAARSGWRGAAVRALASRSSASS